MNDMQIYAQVAKKPRIGASEIATNLGLTLATISADLRVLVDAGDLVKSLHFEENGRQWQVYELSDEFKASRTHKALMGTLERAPAAEPVKAPVTTAAPSQPAEAPPAQKATKVQLGIACITKLGAATDDQLRDAMGLASKTAVRPYLASAINDGRVARDGDRWKLGGAKPEPEKPVAPKEEIHIPRFDQVKPVPEPAPEPAAPALSPAPAAASVASAQHRVAIWSDGTFELETDGTRVAVLTHDQTRALVSFIEKMGAAA